MIGDDLLLMMILVARIRSSLSQLPPTKDDESATSDFTEKHAIDRGPSPAMVPLAEPGARANDLSCHDPCYRTARASRDRGSSLTLGKE